MFILKTAFCRIFQTVFRLALPVLPYREPEIMHTLSDLKHVIQKEQLTSVLIVTDEGIIRSGLVAPLMATLTQNGVACSVYDKTQPNPTVSNVEDALRLYRVQSCNGLIAIGGGSAMDCARRWAQGLFIRKSHSVR